MLPEAGVTVIVGVGTVTVTLADPVVEKYVVSPE
jgi:hypothetical protein